MTYQQHQHQRRASAMFRALPYRLCMCVDTIAVEQNVLELEVSVRWQVVEVTHREREREASPVNGIVDTYRKMIEC